MGTSHGPTKASKCISALPLTEAWAAETIPTCTSVALSLLVVLINAVLHKPGHLTLGSARQYTCNCHRNLAAALQLTDAWATSTFSSCTSLGDLRDKLHRGHLQQAAEKTVNALQLAVTYAIADAFDVQPPESMVRELAEQEYQAQLLQLQSQVRQKLATGDRAVACCA